MADAHLICGSTGAGKTTYARRLAERTGAVVFTLDDWMAALFWPDAPQPFTYDWAHERTERCQSQILTVCGQLLPRGQDVILDLGFFAQVQRRNAVEAVQAHGGVPRLHYLDVPAEERWRRVERRNAERGATYALDVTRGMFDFCETLFEVPGPAELQAYPLGD